MTFNFQSAAPTASCSLLGWSDSARYKPLKSWADELAALRVSACPSPIEWQLIGRAVMIVNDNESHARNVVYQVANHSGYVVRTIDADDVFKLFAEGFSGVSEPTIMLMKQGVWSVEDKTHKNSEEIRAFQENFASLIAAIPGEKALIFVTYGDEYVSLAENLRSAGAFDRRFYIDDVSLTDRAEMLFAHLPADLCGDTLLSAPEKVGQLLECEADSERRIGLVSLALKRLAHREKRKVEYMDLLHFALHGTAECVIEGAAEAQKYNIAVHEAGHALVSMLDSAGQDVPDYAGIVQGQGTLGQVSASYGYLAELPAHGSYKQKRHIVRMLLGGRAAEQIVLGIEEMSVTSAKADLRHATSIAKDLVGRCGISPTLEDEETAGSNLLVRSTDISTAEKTRIENNARLFLSRQYDVVLEMLRGNRSKLDLIAEKLLEKNVLTQDDLQMVITESV